MTTKLNKKFILGTLLMLLTTATLVACGDTPTATPGPDVSTTAAASSTTAAASGAGATTVAGNAAGAPASGTPGAGRGQGQGGFNVATGTVQNYDATSRSLTVMETSGTAQTFDATNAIINKNTKISLADLGKETLATDVIQVTGTKGTDGSYTATALTVTDPATMTNGGFPGAGAANGTPGAGGFAGRGAANGTPGTGGGRAANGTPGANGGFGGGANGGNRLTLSKATISGNTLTGTDQTGAAVTVNLSDSTAITKRTGDTVTDLAVGAKISVNFRAAQNNGAAAAVAITIEQ